MRMIQAQRMNLKVLQGRGRLLEILIFWPSLHQFFTLLNPPSCPQDVVDNLTIGPSWVVATWVLAQIRLGAKGYINEGVPASKFSVRVRHGHRGDGHKVLLTSGLIHGGNRE